MSIVIFRLVVVFIFSFFDLDETNISQNKFLKLAENEFKIKKINDTDHQQQQQLKFIVYECRGWCGGFADRLKGLIYSLLKHSYF